MDKILGDGLREDRGEESRFRAPRPYPEGGNNSQKPENKGRVTGKREHQGSGTEVSQELPKLNSRRTSSVKEVVTSGLKVFAMVTVDSLYFP